MMLISPVPRPLTFLARHFSFPQSFLDTLSMEMVDLYSLWEMTNPVAESGARILHLGQLADPAVPRPDHLPGEPLHRLR